MNNMLLSTETPIDSVKWQNGNGQYDIFIKRDDLIHPFISGNKWRKLKFNLESARRVNAERVVTYGGAYSNHLIATACACAMAGIPATAMVRGEELNPHSNYILRMCIEYGMDLQFVNRSEYNNMKSTNGQDANTVFHIPEGGANEDGIKGCMEIFDYSWRELGITDVVCSVGTSTTFIGLIRSVPSSIHVHGIAAMRDADYLKRHIGEHISSQAHWTLHTEFAGRGFGNSDAEQINCMQNFTSQTGILLDPVYTGKGIAAIEKLLDRGDLAPESRMLYIHTGGLTGLLSDQWLNS